MPQTKRQIQALLAEAGIRPLQRYGQNFLIDGNLMRRLVEAAGATDRDVVLEVGVGTGSLTEMLLEAAGHVVGVEIDRGLHALAAGRVGQHPRLTLMHRDVLASKHRIAPEVLAELRRRRDRLGGRIMLVANLPYQVATPLVVELLLHEPDVGPLCFTVQAEVADRFTAAPGGKDYGPIAVYAQLLTTVRRIARLGPESFWPAPRVDSAMLRLERNPLGRPPEDVLEGLARLVQGCFGQRRKKIRTSLLRLCGESLVAGLEAAGTVDLDARPEQIRVEDWLALARRVVAESAAGDGR